MSCKHGESNTTYYTVRAQNVTGTMHIELPKVCNELSFLRSWFHLLCHLSQEYVVLLLGTVVFVTLVGGRVDGGIEREGGVGGWEGLREGGRDGGWRD